MGSKENESIQAKDLRPGDLLCFKGSAPWPFTHISQDGLANLENITRPELSVGMWVRTRNSLTHSCRIRRIYSDTGIPDRVVFDAVTVECVGGVRIVQHAEYSDDRSFWIPVASLIPIVDPIVDPVADPGLVVEPTLPEWKTGDLCNIVRLNEAYAYIVVGEAAHGSRVKLRVFKSGNGTFFESKDQLRRPALKTGMWLRDASQKRFGRLAGPDRICGRVTFDRFIENGKLAIGSWVVDDTGWVPTDEPNLESKIVAEGAKDTDTQVETHKATIIELRKRLLDSENARKGLLNDLKRRRDELLSCAQSLIDAETEVERFKQIASDEQTARFVAENEVRRLVYEQQRNAKPVSAACHVSAAKHSPIVI